MTEARPPGRYVAYAQADLAWADGRLDEGLINRCHVIAVLDSDPHALSPDRRILVCESVQGWRFLPGGTREPGESVTDLVRRELMEEAGAAPRSPVRLVAGWEARSRLATPYRPHLSHPRSIWALALVAVERVSDPTCPPGGEQIATVHEMTAAEAVSWLSDAEDDLHAVTLQALLTD